jgi:prophage tail gpP-like protein
MPFEIITIAAAGLEIRPITFAWNVSRKDAARSFDAKIKHPFLGQRQLIDALAGSPPVTIRSQPSDGIAMAGGGGGGELILTGHVEKRSPRVAGEEKELSISGRSKTGDLVDSSHNHKTGELRDKNARDMIAELTQPFGISVEADGSLPVRKLARLRPGETIFAFAERLARVDRVGLTDTPEGNLKLAGPPKEAHAGAIVDGGTGPAIVDASGTLDDSKRFQEYSTRAQAPDGYAPAELEIEETARDSGVSRPRRRVITPPEQISKEEARARAKHHRDRAAGKGITASITVVGWRDIAGKLWTPGLLIPVSIFDLGIEQVMMVESVSFKQSDKTTATLELVDPRAHGGKGGKGGKSAKGWSLDGAGAEDE